MGRGQDWGDFSLIPSRTLSPLLLGPVGQTSALSSIEIADILFALKEALDSPCPQEQEARVGLGLCRRGLYQVRETH